MTVLGVPKRRLGVCLTRTEIVFAVVEADGRVVLRGRVPRTTRGREALLDTSPPELELVVACEKRDRRESHRSFVELIRSLATPCWYVPAELVQALRIACGISNGPAELTAALLARLPSTTLSSIRDMLRRDAPRRA